MPGERRAGMLQMRRRSVFGIFRGILCGSLLGTSGSVPIATHHQWQAVAGQGLWRRRGVERSEVEPVQRDPAGRRRSAHGALCAAYHASCTVPSAAALRPGSWRPVLVTRAGRVARAGRVGLACCAAVMAVLTVLASHGECGRGERRGLDGWRGRGSGDGKGGQF